MDVQKRRLIESLVILGEVSSTETAYFHQLAAQALGVGLSEMKALSILLREGATHPGELMKRLNLTTGAVSNLVDRLERKGVVTRKVDPSDRRKVLVEANPAALQAGSATYGSIGRAFADLLSGYTVEQLSFLEDHFQETIKITREQIALLGGRGVGEGDTRGSQANGVENART